MVGKITSPRDDTMQNNLFFYYGTIWGLKVRSKTLKIVKEVIHETFLIGWNRSLAGVL
jgi:hypothetical protein